MENTKRIASIIIKKYHHAYLKRKLALVLPVMTALSLMGTNIYAAQVDQWNVEVSSPVGPACSVSGKVTALSIPSITDAGGKLDSSKGLPPTKVGTITCNGAATLKLDAQNGYYKNTTQTAACTNESSTCVLYDAKLTLGNNTSGSSIVNTNNKSATFTAPSPANGDIKLEVDIVGSLTTPLAVGTFSEIFTVTVSAP